MPADAENEEGLTPLHCAAIGNSAECVQLLLDAKADRNVADHEGRTPCDHAPESAQVGVKRWHAPVSKPERHAEIRLCSPRGFSRLLWDCIGRSIAYHKHAKALTGSVGACESLLELR